MILFSFPPKNYIKLRDPILQFIQNVLVNNFWNTLLNYVWEEYQDINHLMNKDKEVEIFTSIKYG